MKWSCMEFSLPVSGCVGAALMPCGLMFSRAGSGSCHHVQHHFGQAGCDLLGGKPPLWLEPPIDPRDHPGDCQGGKPGIFNMKFAGFDTCFYEALQLDVEDLFGLVDFSQFFRFHIVLDVSDWNSVW